MRRPRRWRVLLGCAAVAGATFAGRSLWAGPPESPAPQDVVSSRADRPVSDDDPDGDGALAASIPGDAAVPPGPAPTPADPRPLTAQLDELLARPPLSGAQIGVAAVDLGSGRLLYERNADLALNPASNTKLITTAAALALLGPEHRFATRIYGEADAQTGPTLRGDLYLRGDGDPALVTADLYELAGDLQSRGVRRVTGGIIVDTRRHDRDELPPAFDQKDEFASYRAPVGAASVNFNTFVVRVRPAERVGDPAVAFVDPPVPSIRVVVEARTVEGVRRRLDVTPKLEASGDTTVVVTGTFGVEASAVRWRYPVQDPSLYAGEVLRLVLAERGVAVARKRIQRGTVPDDAKLLATHVSPSLAEAARSINKLSNNFMAEQVLKDLDPATPATFAGGVARVEGWLARIGVNTTGLRLGNGSGLYDANRVSARQLVQLLRYCHRDFRIASDFLASLAVMGSDGTTASRLATSEARRWIRAKTGTLDGISALSGYAGTLGRPPIAFSVLINGLGPGHAAAAREAQDRIAELLARHAGRSAAAPAARAPGGAPP